MYAQGIATLALCEAYGMTHDPALKPAAQAAIDFIQKAQGPQGSWNYTAGGDHDTSILGWQIQALHAARLSQDLVVDDKVIQKAIKFLDYVSPGQTKSSYGYGNPGEARPATARTAIGLLCRYYVDNWRPETAGFAEGAKGLMQDSRSHRLHRATRICTTTTTRRRSSASTAKRSGKPWNLGLPAPTAAARVVCPMYSSDSRCASQPTAGVGTRPSIPMA